MDSKVTGIYHSMTNRAPGKRQIKWQEHNVLSLIQQEEGYDEDADEDFNADGSKDSCSDHSEDEENSKNDSDKNDSDVAEDQTVILQNTPPSKIKNLSKSHKKRRKSRQQDLSREAKEKGEAVKIAKKLHSKFDGRNTDLLSIKIKRIQQQTEICKAKVLNDFDELGSTNVCLICLKSSGHLQMCHNCGISIHPACYIKSEVSEFSLSNGSRLRKVWFCDSCISNKNPQCELCPVQGGSLKETTTGQWFHVICARYIFRGKLLLTPDNLIDISNMNYKFYGSKDCVLCEDKLMSRTGICIQCDAGLCKNFFHVTCAQKFGLLIQQDTDFYSESNDVYCPVHANEDLYLKTQNNFQLANALLQFQQNKFEKDRKDLKDKRQRLLTQYREAYLMKKINRPQQLTTLKPQPRPLYSNAATLKVLQKKAKHLNVTCNSHLNFQTPHEVRKRRRVSPGLNILFVQQFNDRVLRMQEEKSRLKIAEEINSKLISTPNDDKEIMKTLTDTLKTFDEEICEFEEISSKFEIIENKLKNWLTINTQFMSTYSSSTGLNAKRTRVRSFKPLEVIKSFGSKRKTSQSTKEKPVLPVIDHQSEFTVHQPVVNKCRKCGKDDKQHLLVNCDVCRMWIHLQCLDPPLTGMPKKSKYFLWQCSECQSDSSTDSSDDISTTSSLHRPIKRLRTESRKYSPDNYHLKTRWRQTKDKSKKRKSCEPSKARNAKSRRSVDKATVMTLASRQKSHDVTSTLLSKQRLLDDVASCMEDLMHQLDDDVIITSDTEEISPKMPNQTSNGVSKQPVVYKQPLSVVTCAGVTKQPCAGVSKQPCAGVSKQPCAGASKQPCAGVSKQPCASVSKQPCASVSKQPCAGVFNQPCAGVSRQPFARVSIQTRQPVTTTICQQPATEVAGQPATEFARQPITEVTKQPTSEVARQPAQEVAKQPTTEVTKQPTSEVARQPITAGFPLKSQPISNPISIPVSLKTSGYLLGSVSIQSLAAVSKQAFVAKQLADTVSKQPAVMVSKQQPSGFCIKTFKPTSDGVSEPQITGVSKQLVPVVTSQSSTSVCIQTNGVFRFPSNGVYNQPFIDDKSQLPRVVQLLKPSKLLKPHVVFTLPTITSSQETSRLPPTDKNIDDNKSPTALTATTQTITTPLTTTPLTRTLLTTSPLTTTPLTTTPLTTTLLTTTLLTTTPLTTSPLTTSPLTTTLLTTTPLTTTPLTTTPLTTTPLTTTPLTPSLTTTQTATSPTTTALTTSSQTTTSATALTAIASSQTTTSPTKASATALTAITSSTTSPTTTQTTTTQTTTSATAITSSTTALTATSLTTSQTVGGQLNEKVAHPSTLAARKKAIKRKTAERIAARKKSTEIKKINSEERSEETFSQISIENKPPKSVATSNELVTIHNRLTNSESRVRTNSLPTSFKYPTILRTTIPAGLKRKTTDPQIKSTLQLVQSLSEHKAAGSKRQKKLDTSRKKSRGKQLLPSNQSTNKTASGGKIDKSNHSSVPFPISLLTSMHFQNKPSTSSRPFFFLTSQSPPSGSDNKLMTSRPLTTIDQQSASDSVKCFTMLSRPFNNLSVFLAPKPSKKPEEAMTSPTSPDKRHRVQLSPEDLTRPFTVRYEASMTSSDDNKSRDGVLLKTLPSSANAFRVLNPDSKSLIQIGSDVTKSDERCFPIIFANQIKTLNGTNEKCEVLKHLSKVNMVAETSEENCDLAGKKSLKSGEIDDSLLVPTIIQGRKSVSTALILKKSEPKKADDVICAECKKTEDQESMYPCGSCGISRHFWCWDPPLNEKTIKRSHKFFTWKCDECFSKVSKSSEASYKHDDVTDKVEEPLGGVLSNLKRSSRKRRTPEYFWGTNPTMLAVEYNKIKSSASKKRQNSQKQKLAKNKLKKNRKTSGHSDNKNPMKLENQKTSNSVFMDHNYIRHST